MFFITVCMLIILFSYGLPISFRLHRVLLHAVPLTLMGVNLLFFYHIAPISGPVPYFGKMNQRNIVNISIFPIVTAYYGIILISLLSMVFTFVLTYWFSMIAIQEYDFRKRRLLWNQMKSSWFGRPTLERHYGNTVSNVMPSIGQRYS